MIHGAVFLVPVLVLAALLPGQERSCSTPLPEASVHVPVDGRPVDVLTDRTGCHVFVTVVRDSGRSGLLVLRRAEASLAPVQFIPLEGAPFGMRFSPDRKTLYVAAGTNVAVVDAGLAVRPSEAPAVGVIRDSTFVGAVMVNVTRDGRYLFVSQERAAAVTVIDVAPNGQAGARIVGRIPTGRAPIALELLRDGRRLYVTSQEAPDDMDLPIECRPQANRADPPDHRAGAILVIDVERAVTDPASSIVGKVKAGCNPVRLVLSPDGRWTYVSARTDDEVLVFRTATLEREGALPLARIPVGTAPVGLAVTPDGQRLFVTSSNRFAGSSSDRQDVYVLDARRAPAGAVSVLGTLRAGAFPRQLFVGPDARTLFVTNFSSGTLQVIDLLRARPEAARQRAVGLDSTARSAARPVPLRPH